MIHAIEMHALGFGIALLAVGVALYLLLRRRAVVYNSVPPEPADVRVRPGQSYRQALEEKATRR